MKKTIKIIMLLIFSVVICCACDKTSGTKTTNLKTPADYSLVGRRLTWNEVSGAASYNVSVNSQIVNLSVTSFVITPSDAETYNIDIVAVSGLEGYNDSAPLSLVVTKSDLAIELDTPAFPNVMSGQFNWSGVPDAESYQVEVTDPENIVSYYNTAEVYLAINSIIPLNPEAGTYKLRVRAIGDGELSFDSAFTNYVTLVYSN